MKKIKILLDSDVVVHFIKGECFSLLFDIFPDYQYAILDVVYAELKKHRDTQVLLDNTMYFFKNKIEQLKFQPTGEYRQEYAQLQRTLGKGESACMVYCLEHYDVLGSSNLKDIKEYCTMHNITYLTTIDFLYYAYKKGLITAKGCKEFINKVREKKSKLPEIDIETYICPVQL